MDSGDTFVIVELLSPDDSQYFKKTVKKECFRDLTPKSEGNTFCFKHPTEDWMKQVANLNPEWWYISGHSARTADNIPDHSFFNQSYCENEYQSNEKSNPESWRIRMEYAASRDELKAENFFEEYGPNGVSYSNAKVVLLVGCNTLVRPVMRKYLSQLFPNAILLGHIDKNPADATPIIKNFLKMFFTSSTYDWWHIMLSWLSYYDIAKKRPRKDSIPLRGYGLAGLYKGNVYGIYVDNSIDLNPLAKEGERVERARARAKHPPPGCQPGCNVDVLKVWDNSGKLITWKGMYEGEKGRIRDWLNDSAR